MKTWGIVIATFLSSFGVLAQEHLAIRLNEQGLVKIMEMALRYNAGGIGEPKTFTIPSSIYKFTLPKETLDKNPIVQVANEISDLNMNRDLDFYFHTSAIKITGEVDTKSLKTTISNSNENGFDLKMELRIPRITVKAPKLSLCEDKADRKKACGEGLKATLNNVSIMTKDNPVKLTASFRLRTVRDVATLRVLSVSSNLEAKDGPGLDIAFQHVEVPKISIVINGQETELDTSRLRDEVLKRKAFLAQKLMSFAADFIASDLAEMVNGYLIKRQIATSYQVLNQEGPISFNDFLKEGHQTEEVYVRSSIAEAEEKDPITLMLSQIADVIHNASARISLTKISTPENRNIELAGKVQLILNNQSISVGNTYGNSALELPKMDLSSLKGSDVNLVISEPLINGTLDLVNSTGLFQELFDSFGKVKGVSIASVKAHFFHNGGIAVVANTKVDLKKLESLSFGESVKNWIAAILERNTNGAIIYFPIQIDVIPSFKKKSDGSLGLDLLVKSPFIGNELLNTYHYPTNVNEMSSGRVRNGIMEKLKLSLGEFTEKTYSVDLDKFLNQSGVEFKPRYMDVKQNAYFVLGLDIEDIKFNGKNPVKR